jgi:hypothetical protein
MTTLDEDLAALRALDRDALIARYRAETGREPRQRSAAWLVRRLAWREQERRLGGLSATARGRLDELIAQIDLKVDAPVVATGAVAREQMVDGPAVGTTLVREWRGRQIQVRVTDDGFECDGAIHKSLSAVAKAVTGTHWNGKLFFGLTKRKTG